jgi:hypothetical protein
MCQDSFLSSVLLTEDSWLALPDASVEDVDNAVRFFSASHYDDAADEQLLVPGSLCSTLYWINWKKWLDCDKTSEIITGQNPAAKRSKAAPKFSSSSKRPRRIRHCDCSICGKTLYDKHSLKKHQDVVHFNIRPHGCPVCQKRFSVANDLRDHVAAVHAKEKVKIKKALSQFRSCCLALCYHSYRALLCSTVLHLRHMWPWPFHSPRPAHALSSPQGRNGGRYPLQTVPEGVQAHADLPQAHGQGARVHAGQTATVRHLWQVLQSQGGTCAAP